MNPDTSQWMQLTGRYSPLCLPLTRSHPLPPASPQLYAGYDSDGNGRLDPHELGLLLGELLGGPEGGGGFRPAQLKYAAVRPEMRTGG